jgi:hypothetical protein
MAVAQRIRCFKKLIVDLQNAVVSAKSLFFSSKQKKCANSETQTRATSLIASSIIPDRIEPAFSRAP